MRRACREAGLELDQERGRGWSDVPVELRDTTGDPEVALRAEGASDWLRVLAGGPLEHDAATLAREARRLGVPDLVIEGTSLTLIAALSDGAHAKALDAARRIFHMARTDGMPELQYLAGWVLARARRLSGRPYLAARILRALREVATPA